MGRYLTWNDEFCPNGHRWVFIQASGLYPDYYYCIDEDKFWEPTVKSLIEANIVKNYNHNRPDEMRKLAIRKDTLRKINAVPHEKFVKFASVLLNPNLSQGGK